MIDRNYFLKHDYTKQRVQVTIKCGKCEESITRDFGYKVNSGLYEVGLEVITDDEGSTLSYKCKNCSNWIDLF